MGETYRKIQVKMGEFREEYRYWKMGSDDIFCQIEEYENQRAIYMSVKNLIPSRDLWTDRKEHYQIILLGDNRGQLVYKEFEKFYIERNGEGYAYRRFDGESIECYNWCVLLAVNEETAETTEISRGFIFFMPKGAVCEPFSSDIDETKAKWQRIEVDHKMPGWIMGFGDNLEKYKHYIIGTNKENTFVGVPGRFLLEERPKVEGCEHMLWQPIKGGEEYFDNAEEMNQERQNRLFGYWVGILDQKKGAVIAF